MRIDKHYKIRETMEVLTYYEVMKRVKWMKDGEILTLIGQEDNKYEMEDFK